MNRRGNVKSCYLLSYQLLRLFGRDVDELDVRCGYELRNRLQEENRTKREINSKWLIREQKSFLLRGCLIGFVRLLSQY